MKLNKFFVPLLLMAFIQAGVAWAAVINRSDDFGNFVRLKSRSVATGAHISVFQPPPAPTKKFYILQFKGPVEESWKSDISSLGVKFLGYVPDNAFLVKVPQKSFSDVQADPNVMWLGEYLPDDKTDRKITTDILTGHTGVKKFVVKVFDGEDMPPVINSIQSLGGDVEVVSDSDELNGKVLNVTIDETATKDITSIPSVEFIEEHPVRVLHNNVAVQPNQMNVTPAWSLPSPLTGLNQVVGIIDTGIDTGDTSTIHPAFAGNAGNGQPKIKSTFTYGRTGVWSDPDGHGTHTSGSLAGMAPAPLQSYSIKGVAYDAQIVLQSALTSGGGLSIPDLNSTAFPDAYGQGARVHSNSWGDIKAAGQYNSDSISADTFAWNHKDFLAAFSAGNDGVDVNSNGIIDSGSISPPATAKDVLAVGASENYRPTFPDTYGSGWPKDYTADPIKSDLIANNPNGMVAFSSRGPTSDGRIKPDVVAPGTFILSTKSSLAPSGNYWLVYNTYFAYDGGTSMSCPLTAGAAAIVRQYYNDTKGVSNPSAALIKATIINGATDMSPGQYGAVSTRDVTGWPDNNQGWGRVNLARSVAPSSPSALDYVDDNTGFATGSHATDTYFYTVGDASVPVRVTLVWTDYPGSLAAPTLVNDLDLEVTAPNGDIYHGNISGKNPVIFDHLNNVESIEIPVSVSSLTTGTLTVKVIADSINQGPQQPYALAIRYGKGTASILPLSASYAKASGSGSISVTTSDSWTAVSNNTWITVTSGSSGTGNGTVNYSVAAYTGTGSRTGSITVAGLTFNVTQNGVQSLTISSSPPAGGTTNYSSGTYDYNSTISLQATPNAGYVFTGWSGSITGLTNPVSVKMDSDKTVVANFHSNIFNLTVSSNPPAGGTTNYSSGPYAYNTNLSLQATPADGYIFTGWSGSVTGATNPINVLMNSDKTVAANFVMQGIALGYTQNLSTVTLTASMYYNGVPQSGKSITFYDQIGSGSFASKGSATTDINGVATKTLTTVAGSHTAYAKFNTSGVIPTMQSPNTSYTMASVALTSPVNASTVAASPLTFTWQAFAGATGYHIQISTSSKFGTGTLAYATAGTSYDLNTSVLLPGKTYYWRVCADIPTGTSMYSATWKFIYKKATRLSLAYVGMSGPTVTLRATLTEADGTTPVAGRKLTFYENTNGGLTYSSKGTATTGSITSLTPGVVTKSWTTTAGSHNAYAKFLGDTTYAPILTDPADVSYSY